MTKEQIIEGNRLIAEFMGLHFHKVGWVDNTHIDGNYECEELKYSCSWDWIMPVVGNIKKSYNGYIEYEIIEAALCRIDIEDTWLAVIEFIKWYNQNI